MRYRDGVTFKAITEGLFISFSFWCFLRNPCMWTFLVPAIQTQLNQPSFRQDTSPGTEPTRWEDWPSTPLILWVQCWRMGSCRWMKREPSCCSQRYDLSSLEYKILPCSSLQMLSFCCIGQTDLEGLAGAKMISLVNVPSTYQHYLSAQALSHFLALTQSQSLLFLCVVSDWGLVCKQESPWSLDFDLSWKLLLKCMPSCCEGNQDCSAW